MGASLTDHCIAAASCRLIWTTALHKRFLEALDKVGGVDRALPKAVMRVRRPGRLLLGSTCNALQASDVAW